MNFQELKIEIEKRYDTVLSLFPLGFAFENPYKKVESSKIIEKLTKDFDETIKDGLLDATIIDQNREFFAENGIYHNENVVSGFLLATGDQRYEVSGDAVAVATDNVRIAASSHSWVYATSKATVIACNSTRVYASDTSRVYASDIAIVFATDDTTVFATERATVDAYRRSRVEADDHTTIIASGSSRIKARGYSRVFLEWCARVEASEFSYTISKNDEPFTVKDFAVYLNQESKSFKLAEGVKIQ